MTVTTDNAAVAAAFYDALECRDPQLRERDLLAALPRQIAIAQSRTRAFSTTLANIDAATVTSRKALASLPVLHKHDLFEKQRTLLGSDIFGGFSAIGWRDLNEMRGARKVFQSPGPIYEPEGEGDDYWRTARALFAAGFRHGDLLHNSFSYHLTPAGSMMEAGARALGCTVFPAGVGNTELQLQAIAELRPDGYVGTPSFLKILVDKAEHAGIELPSLRKALVSGEAFPASLRDWLGEHGIAAYQCYATADLGMIAYETSARDGLVLDEGVIVEIVRPGTGDVLPDGEVGELVITTLNPDYPLIRFATGDLSAIQEGHCPTGRTNIRIKGWMGRADQTAKVRGMFVHPSQVAEIVRRHPAIGKARLVVSGEMANDRMALHIEVEGKPPELAARVTETLRDVTKLRGDVEICAPGSLPNDGKVIEDARKFD